jgi:hypothetical protein
VLDAEFLPFEKNLYIVVADGDEDLQVLQYDNEGVFIYMTQQDADTRN